jgi:basic membrane lipoprotein Med (substrate-binding protein (PBP1-ABC) superfamily)
MARTTDTVISIVKIGASVVVGTHHTTESVKSIVRAAISSGSHVTVLAGNRTTESLKAIASLAPKQVTIDLS